VSTTGPVGRQGRQRMCWFDNSMAWSGMLGDSLLNAVCETEVTGQHLLMHAANWHRATVA